MTIHRFDKSQTTSAFRYTTLSIFVLLIGGLGGVALLSQFSKQKPIGTPKPATNSIRISHTACYGTCPIYDVEINSDGLVIFDGKNFVADSGKKQWVVKPESKRKISTALSAIKLNQLKSEYNEPRVTDCSWLNVTIRKGKVQKMIAINSCSKIPKSLKKLLDDLEKWAGVESHVR